MNNADINKFIRNERGGATDAGGRLFELEPWSPEVARQLAAEEGIAELTDEHLEVIEFIRDRYIEKGPARSAREVVYDLDKRFADRGGRRHLYQLFPNGPVTQGSKLAGVPAPPYHADKSFGAVE